MLMGGDVGVGSVRVRSGQVMASHRVGFQCVQCPYVVKEMPRWVSYASMTD